MNTAPSSTWTHEPPRFDVEQTRAELQTWLRARTERGDLEVTDLTQPAANGGTGDNLLVTVRHGDGHERLVVRLQPTQGSPIHEVSIELHFRVLRTLRDTPVPSPSPLWLETDAAVIGAPFLVMECVPGEAPSDFPIYNEAGFVYEATPAQRHDLWSAGLEALCQVHRIPAGFFAYLDDPDRGANGLRQHIAYLRESYEHAPIPESHEPFLRSLAWVEKTAPSDPLPGLCWGDARIGNILFDKEDATVRALLDWDQASLAGPLVDLGWWLLFDLLHAEDYGSPRLEGLGTREETIERWQHRTGLSAEPVEWYEILAGLRLAIVRFRGTKARELKGLWAPDETNPRSWQRLMTRVESMIAAYEG